MGVFSHFCKLGYQYVRILLNRAVKQYFFGWKITVAKALRYSDGFRNIRNRDFFIALLTKQFQGSIKDLLSAFFRLFRNPHVSFLLSSMIPYRSHKFNE